MSSEKKEVTRGGQTYVLVRGSDGRWRWAEAGKRPPGGTYGHDSAEGAERDLDKYLRTFGKGKQ